SGEACGATQFPGESVLALRPVDGLPEQRLRSERGVRSTQLQNDLAFDAEQLGNIPAAVGGRGALERPVDCCEALGAPPARHRASASSARNGSYRVWNGVLESSSSVADSMSSPRTLSPRLINRTLLKQRPSARQKAKPCRSEDSSSTVTKRSAASRSPVSNATEQ